MKGGGGGGRAGGRLTHPKKLPYKAARSSYRKCSVKKGVFKNVVANFTRKYLCWSFFLMKLQALEPVTLLKRNSNMGVLL